MRFVYICTVTSQTNGVTRLFIWLQIYSEILLWQGRIFHLTSMFRKVFRRILLLKGVALLFHSFRCLCTQFTIGECDECAQKVNTQIASDGMRKNPQKTQKIDIKWLNPVWSSWLNEWKLRWVSSISDQYYHIQHLNSQRNSIVFSLSLSGWRTEVILHVTTLILIVWTHAEFN